MDSHSALRRASLARVLLLVAALVAVGVTVIWGSLDRAPERAAPEQAGSGQERAAAALPPPRQARERPRPAQAPETKTTGAKATGAKATGAPAPSYRWPIMPPGPHDPHDMPMHPHPITPDHLEIRHELEMIHGLDQAMDKRDVPKMRKLLEEFRARHKEDPLKLQEGYEIIADCLEFPGDASRRVAQHHWDTYRGSTLRRWVRRHCLEAPR